MPTNVTTAAATGLPAGNAPTILYVANKRLPPNDYRILLGRNNPRYRIIYALPEPTEGLDPRQYVRMAFKEGISACDFANYLRLGAYLIRYRRRLDLVHFYSTKLVLGGPALTALCGIPSIVTVTGLGRSFSGSGPGSRLLRFAYLRLMYVSAGLSRKVLFQNRGDMATLAQHLPRFVGKFEYVGSTVDMPVLAVRLHEFPRLRVLLVTRLLPDKGIEDFLAVAERLTGGDFEFALVGPPSSGFAPLEHKVRAAHDRGVIEYKGELDSRGIQHEYASAQVFYFPSFYGEGLARVMLECGLAGICPIACDIPANRDLVAEGRGFLIKPGDREAVIALLMRLASDRELLRANAAAYQEHVVQSYSVSSFTAHMERIVEQSLAASADGTAK